MPVSRLGLLVCRDEPTGVLAGECLARWADELAVVIFEVLDLEDGVDLIFQHGGQEVVLSATEGVWRHRR